MSAPLDAGELDRTREPDPLTPRHYHFPSPLRGELPNGLRVMVSPRRELPLVTVLIGTEAGATLDPPGEEGLAWMTARVLNEGAGPRGASELAEEVEQLGVRLDSYCGWDSAAVRVGVLAEKLDAALALAADVALRPRFEDAEVDREVRQRLAEIQSDRDDPRSIATERYIHFLFGSHRYGTLLAGTEKSIAGLTPEKLRSRHEENLVSGGSYVIFVGDVGPEEGLALAERHFGGWKPGVLQRPPVGEPAPLPPTHIHLVDKPGAVQSEVRVSQLGVPRSAPDYFPLIVMNAILGEAFGSRLFFNLREKHGFTYAVSSSFGMRRGRGPFVASAAVQTSVTDAALVEFMREMRNIRDVPPSAKELRDAKGYLSGGLAVDLQSNGSVAERISEGEIYGLGIDYMDLYRDNILAVTSQDVERVARHTIDPDHMAITIVGDAKEIAAPLGKIYPVTLYDVMGNKM